MIACKLSPRSSYIWKASPRSKKFARRLLLSCDHRQARFRFTLSTEWVVLFPGARPAFRRRHYARQTTESWTGRGERGLGFQIPHMNLAARTYRRQHELRRSKDWPSSKPNGWNPNATLPSCQWSLHNDGQPYDFKCFKVCTRAR